MKVTVSEKLFADGVPRLEPLLDWRFLFMLAAIYLSGFAISDATPRKVESQVHKKVHHV